MTEPNIPLLRKMVEWAEEQETLTTGREWHQGNWFTKEPLGTAFLDCGTSYCLAGKIALDAGWKPEWDGTGFITATVVKDGEALFVRDVANELLGLHEDQTRWLFFYRNNAARVREVAETIAGEKL